MNADNLISLPPVCAFCGLNANEVQWMIAGPECISVTSASTGALIYLTNVRKNVNRLLIDLKEDCSGVIVGRVNLPADSLFALEALAEAIEQLSKSCGVSTHEILNDIRGVLKA